MGKLRSWPLAFILCCFVGCVQEKDASNSSRLIMPGDGFTLQALDNSDSVSQATDINAHGHVIGMREMPDENKTIFRNQYYFDNGKESLDLAVLKGYTNSEVEALSDSGLAVGFASRSLRHPDGSLTALLWDTNQNQVIDLKHIEGDRASHAQDISADGARIVGYSTGFEPQRLRPCIWEKQEGKWDATALPTIMDYNPYTMSSTVAISPDGKLIATCISESIDGNTLNSSLYVWQEDTSGIWERTKRSDEQIYVRGINSKGLIVGELSVPGGKRVPCLVRPDGEFVRMQMFAGMDSGAAYGLNEAGVIVGVCNDPAGPEGGPHPFLFRDGKMEPLPLPEDSEFSMIFAINENGQIAGFSDILFQDRTEKDPETGEEIPLVKALAFVWEPK